MTRRQAPFSHIRPYLAPFLSLYSSRAVFFLVDRYWYQCQLAVLFCSQKKRNRRRRRCSIDASWLTVLSLYRGYGWILSQVLSHVDQLYPCRHVHTCRPWTSLLSLSPLPTCYTPTYLLVPLGLSVCLSVRSICPRARARNKS